MANNYLQFSEEILELTLEEKAWVVKELEAREDKNGDSSWPDFAWDLELNNLWIHADEYGNLDNVGDFVCRFLRKFRPKDFFVLSWAEVCSKPRIHEFAGGALFVTSKGVSSMNTESWLEDQKKVFKGKKKARKKPK